MFQTGGLFGGSSSGAQFSPCGRYRFRLHRTWNSNLPAIGFLMLNPSRANAERTDPTVERCLRRAIKMKYGRLEVVNLFALVSTDPAALDSASDPVGPGNDEAILTCAKSVDMLVCAWGEIGALGSRARHVVRMLQAEAMPLHALALNKSGMPKHPLYVAYKTAPFRWNGVIAGD